MGLSRKSWFNQRKWNLSYKYQIEGFSWIQQVSWIQLDDRWVEKSEISTLRLLYESNELRTLGDNGENWAKDIPNRAPARF